MSSKKHLYYENNFHIQLQDQIAIVPSQELKGGLNISQNKFLVSDKQPDPQQLWLLIKNGLNEFKITEIEYSRNSAASKNFNKDLSKSVGAKSYIEFWKNSQLIQLAERDEKIIIQSFKRALNHKSYQGSFLPMEEFERHMTDIIAKRIIEIFSLMNKQP